MVKQENSLPQGAFVNRNFRSNEFEYYIQDAWHLSSNVTAHRGPTSVVSCRHLMKPTASRLLRPSTCTTGLTRVSENAAKGLTVQPDIPFAPSGQARGLKPYWDMQKNAIAPRIAVAYSPTPSNVHPCRLWHELRSLRSGHCEYFDQQGSFGLEHQHIQSCEHL